MSTAEMVKSTSNRSSNILAELEGEKVINALRVGQEAAKEVI